MMTMTGTHEAIEMLLPWYVNGTLDADELGQVNQHLDDCAPCRALLAEERQLKTAFAGMLLSPSHSAMSPIVQPGPPAPARRSWVATDSRFPRWRRQPMHVAGFVAAQAALLAAVFVLSQPSARPDTSFRMLSAPVSSDSANAIIIFKPDTPEADFRRLLVSAHATVVGGPTDSHSYLLSIAADQRDNAVNRLRDQPQVVLVQPIDQEQ